MRSPYPARRIPVDRTPSLPGAPRLRASRPLTGADAERIRDAADNERRVGVNAADGTTWGAYYPGVTSRKALKRAAWSSKVAGGEYVTAPGV